MKRTLTILFAFVLFSCENRTEKHSGLNDLVVGSQQIILYDNNDFYLELGGGGQEGKYQIINDTIHLTYDSKPNEWPEKIIISDQYFITVPNDEHKVPVKISRPKEAQ